MDNKKWEVECVIYDCDGVLFDSLDANSRLYNYIATSTERGSLSPDELWYCHTHTVYESINHLFKHDGKLEQKALDLLKTVNLGDFVVYLKMEPNLIETLTELKKRNVGRAISTNRTTSMKSIMERFNLDPYFEMVVTALDVKHPKPHPESVERILAALKYDRKKTLYIGDSGVDRETALSSGVKFIAYKNKEIAEDGFIDDHRALLDFLSSEEHSRE